MSEQTECGLERDSERRGICDVFTRDIERGAVINTGTHKRQTHRDVDPFIHTKIFDWDQTLIVLLSDADVELAVSCAHKKRITRPGA